MVAHTYFLHVRCVWCRALGNLMLHMEAPCAHQNSTIKPYCTQRLTLDLHQSECGGWQYSINSGLFSLSRSLTFSIYLFYFFSPFLFFLWSRHFINSFYYPLKHTNYDAYYLPGYPCKMDTIQCRRQMTMFQNHVHKRRQEREAIFLCFVVCFSTF